MLRTGLWAAGAIAVGVAASPALAQWTSDAGTNTVVADGVGDQTVPIVRAAADGGVWVYFYDNGGGGGYKPSIQRLAADGTRAFAGNGVVLANRTNTAVFTSDMKVGGDGAAYAAFDDNGGTVTVQKVLSDGSLPWGATGVQLPTLAGSLGNRVTACADGTIVVAGAVSNVLQFQRLNPNGGLLDAWSLAETGHAQSASDIISGGNGGDVILLWVRAEGTNPILSRKGLKIQKWDAAHAALWSGPGGPGTPIDVYASSASPSRGIQNGYFPPLVSDGAGGAVVAWYDNAGDRNAWLQHVESTGTVRFAANGLAMSTVPPTTEYRLSASVAYLPAVQEYVVAYERSNPNQSLYGLGAQRVSAEGTLLWGGGAGLELIPLDTGNHKSFVSTMPAPTDDAVVTWLEYTDANGPMLVDSTRLDGAGAQVWSPGTLGVCTNPTSKGRLGVAGVVSGDMLVAVWQDGAAGTADVKAQNINFDGTLGQSTPPCPADLDGSGAIDLADLATLLSNFGNSGATAAQGDLDGDSQVTLTDLAMLLSAFGADCP